jgi:predicted phosphoribosyltransferase
VQIPAQLFAIGEWYQRFDQLEDAEVVHLLARARAQTAGLRDPAATKY